MIKAEHKRWARILFNTYIRRLLRKNFSHFYLVNKPPEVDADKGLLITPNHFSWWDGFFIDHVMRKYSNRKIHIMMLEEQLKRYWFFRKLGAYSIKLHDSVSIAESMHYTLEILKNPGNYVVFYPQGEIQPYDKRPIIIKPGLQRLMQNSSTEIIILPAAFKIQYGEKHKPDVIARFATPLQGKQIGKNFTIFRDAFIHNIDKLDEAGRNKEYIIDLFS